MTTDLPLPEGIESSYIDCSSTSGLKVHILSSGTNTPLSPLLLFCHGFPELAYSWRHILPYFGSKGYFCVAFDQRGYGRTTGWDTRSYDELDINTFGPMQNVIDVLALVKRLGREHVDVLIGHDFGAVTAATCALVRPDIFKACVLMSHPFDGVPGLQGSVEAEAEAEAERQTAGKAKADPNIQQSLAQLGRKHYKWANSTPNAASEWDHPAQGLPALLRGYFYLKSASDKRNDPSPRKSWTAEELVRMPHYYVQKLELSMAETVAEDTHGHEDNVQATQTWLSAEELDVYVQEWQRTGFRGALSWYRNRTMASGGSNHEMMVFAGKKIEVPTVFISGKQDWGNYQKPGAFEGMAKTCLDFRGVQFIDGAGHWPQQERPNEVADEIERFIASLGISRNS